LKTGDIKMKNNKKVVLISALAIVSLIVFGTALATAKAATSSTGTPLFKVRASNATGEKVEVTTNYLNQSPKVDEIVGAPNGDVNSPMQTLGGPTCASTICRVTCVSTFCRVTCESTCGIICNMLTLNYKCPRMIIIDDIFTGFIK
jgi:hypothetical protein